MTATDTAIDLEARARSLAAELATDARRAIRLANLGTRAEEAADEARMEIGEAPLCCERMVTYRVTLGTGGPACGVDFDVDEGRVERARAWYQDWFTERSFVPLDDDAAEYLFDLWCYGVE